MLKQWKYTNINSAELKREVMFIAAGESNFI